MKKETTKQVRSQLNPALKKQPKREREREQSSFRRGLVLWYTEYTHKHTNTGQIAKAEKGERERGEAG